MSNVEVLGATQKEHIQPQGLSQGGVTYDETPASFKKDADMARDDYFLSMVAQPENLQDPDSIKDIQTFLSNNRVKTKVDGILGNETINSIQTYMEGISERVGRTELPTEEEELALQQQLFERESPIEGVTAMEKENFVVNNAVNQYAKNLKEFEGNYRNASFVHKPTRGSGLTIAQGLDSAFTSRKEMEDLEVPSRILDLMEEAGAWEKGTSATLPPNSRNVRMTEEEFEVVSRNIAATKVKLFEEYSNKNPKLSENGLAILANLKHWAGSFRSNKESKLTRYEDNLKGAKKTTGSLVSPVQDVLNDRNATDEDLAEALRYIRNSYIPWGAGKKSFRYKTLTKYINTLS